ncbi:MAG: preprotein translocase subunit SecG [SAR324 cluster bacterium]|nr:preprotein translocase subunit SecG [SAR324 cluster bacterium]
MNTPLIVIHIIVCITIILIVLLQVGKGAEAGAVFGGTGQVQSSRGQATFVGKLTTGLAVTFMLTSFLLTYTTSNSAKSSVIDKVSQEQIQSNVEKDSAEKTSKAAE